MKAPIGGSGTVTTLVSGNGSPLAVDANNLYYGFQGLGGANTYGPVFQLPLAGGTPTTLATGLYMVNGIAVDGANVYWADNSGSVLRVPGWTWLARRGTACRALTWLLSAHLWGVPSSYWRQPPWPSRTTPLLHHPKIPPPPCDSVSSE